MVPAEKQKLAKLFSGVFTIGSATLLSRILGFVRDAIVAMLFGAGIYSDAFFMAFRIPNLLRKFFSDGVLSLSFIPEFTKCHTIEGKEKAFDMARSFFCIISFAGVLLVLCGIVYTPGLVSTIAPGFVTHAQKYDLTVALTRIMMPYVGAIFLMAVCMGILNACGHFAAPAVAPIVFNVVIIFFALVLSPLFDMPAVALAWGVTLGGVFQLLLQLPFIYGKGFRFLKRCHIMNPGAVKAAGTMLPAMVGGAGYQINVLVVTFMASRLGDGSISYLYYADRLVQFPLALFTVSVSTVIFPRLASSVAINRQEDATELFSRGLQAVFFITLPAMAGLMVLGKPIVALLFFQGEFEMTAVVETGSVLFFLSTGLWAFSGTRLFGAFFYAFSDIKTPFVAGFCSIWVNVVLGWGLMKSMGHTGLALSLSVSAVVNLVILLWKANVYFTVSVWQKMLLSGAKALVFSGIMYGVVGWASSLLCPALDAGKPALCMGVLLSIMIGVLVYGGLFFVGGRQEYRRMQKWVKGSKKNVAI
ncbi:putative peptidoglycan lipid II flippase [Desulfocicer vacuolatum DSM 3385]|uniref:Probable lipid II flippase MurJ n=1 Tax=Desulfocicer vacuolatum DSM 3385 TaxID=1121400 RepID=A0A1W2B9C1_9BACT|nr:murein biosynthesis integral membrane protein MurJ [Desulfocicer vacuolatum]SMC69381.1 putative peptidoglycan lipid II flippase [Desulfocicer vacuolatum DSM 3385]